MCNKIIFKVSLRFHILSWLCFFLFQSTWSWSCTNFSYSLLTVLRLLIVSYRLRRILLLMSIILLWSLIVNWLLSISLLLRVSILLRVLRILLWNSLIPSIILLLRIIISKTIHKVCNLRSLATHFFLQF